MHRSGSNTRVSDEFYSCDVTPVATGRMSFPGGGGGQRSSFDQLPKYNPQSEIAKKEAGKLKSAENAVHFIPLVLIVCALILWFFSSPHIGLFNKETSMVDGNHTITFNATKIGTEQEDGGILTEKHVVSSRTNRKFMAWHETHEYAQQT